MDPRRFINTFLDSPIIRTDRDKLYHDIIEARWNVEFGRSVRAPKHIKRWIDHCASETLECLNPDDYEAFDASLPEGSSVSHISEAIEIANAVCLNANKGLRKWGLNVESSGWMTLEANVHPYAVDLYWKHIIFRKWVDECAVARSQGIKTLISTTTLGVTITGTEYTAIIKTPGIPWLYLLSYEQVLMFKDMYWGRFNSVIGSLRIYPGSGVIDAMKAIFSWCFRCLTRHGNPGYGIVKSTESLAKAWICEREDPIFGREYAVRNLMDKVRKKEEDLGTVDDFLIDSLNSIRRDHLSRDELVELYGLQKLSGHPLINPATGGRAVQKESMKIKEDSPASIQRIRNNFCRIYTEGYVRKQREWPPLSFERESMSTRLRELYITNETRVSRLSYDLSDWNYVRFAKHWDFDYYDNFTDLIDDRSLSYYRPDIAATWDKAVKPRSHRRLLLEMLSKPEISIFQIVERVRKGDIPFDWLVVSLYPKEREFKESARMFAMMVLEMRFFFAASEANLADHVFPFLPQQTMTLSQREVKDLFYQALDTLDDSDVRRVFWGVDLSGWNHHFHPEVVDPVGRDLEDMCGLPGVFTVVHHFFEQCVILVRVNSDRPPFVDRAALDLPSYAGMSSDLMWFNHRVGHEGIFQKGWTCVTYAMVDLALQDFNFRYYLIGQGDNQIILAYVDCSNVANVQDYLQNMSTNVLQRIEDVCWSIGQIAKPEECDVSSNTVTYSKNVYINGVEYYTSIKAYSRIFPRSSSDFPSINANIGGISGACITAASQLKYPLHGYWLWIFHASLYLITLRTATPVEAQNLSRDYRKKLTSSMIASLLILPSSLGGLNTAGVCEFIYKGASDPLTKDYASLRFHQDGSIICRRMLSTLRRGVWFKSSPEIDGIIMDPYSLPIARMSPPETRIQQRSMARIKQISKNKAIREIMELDENGYSEMLIEALSSVTPFNPLLLSDIFGWSLSGLKRSIGRMYTSTRTIQAVLQGDGEENPCGVILGTGLYLFVSVLLKISNLDTPIHYCQSITQDVEHLRKSWQKVIPNGLCGVTTVSPFDHQLHVADHVLDVIGPKAALICNTGPMAQNIRGPELPYVGLSTREKRSEHGYRIVTDSAPSRAVERFANIISQPGLDTSFKALISQVAQSRGNIDLLEASKYLSRTYGGSLVHRYRARFSDRGVEGLGMHNVASNCVFSTNTASPISGGVDDYNKMVQEDIVTLLMSLLLLSQVRVGIVYVALDYSSYPWVPVPEETLSWDGDLAKLHPPLVRSSIAYADSIMLQRATDRLPTPLVSHPSLAQVEKSLPLWSLYRVIWRAMETSHSALAVSDQATGTITLKLDVLELYGCTLAGFIFASSLCLTRWAIDRMFSRAVTNVRWSPLPGMWSLATALSKTITSHLMNPMFRDDPTMREMMGVSSVKYSTRRGTLTYKITMQICRRAIGMINDPLSRAYSYPEMLFSDEQLGSRVRVLRRFYSIFIYRSILNGESSVDQAFSLVQKFAAHSVQREVTQENKLLAMYRCVLLTASWAQECHYWQLYADMRVMSLGQMCMFIEIPAYEALRSSRKLAHDVCSISKATLACNTVWVKPVTISAIRTRGSSELANPAWGVPTDQRIWDLFSAVRMIGREYGGDSSSGYSHLPLIDLTRGKIVLTVGTGFGSGAATLVYFGSLHVYGTDLQTDRINMYTLDFLPPPTLIHSCGMENKFTHIPYLRGESGNLYEYDSVLLMKSTVSTGGVWVIDVPLLTRQDWLNMARSVSWLPEGITICVRWIGLRELLSDIFSLCSLYLVNLAFRPVIETSFLTEGWMTGVTSKSTVSPAPIDILCPVPPNQYSLEFLGGGSDYLRGALLGPLYGCSMNQARMVSEEAYNLMLISVGEHERRYTFEQFTTVLQSLLFLQIIQSESPISSISQLLMQDVTTVTVGDSHIQLALTRETTRLMTRVVPRLL